MVHKAVQVGEKVIRAKAKPVRRIDAATKRLVRDLIDSMHAHDLVGMAAPQIGVGLQVFVIELRSTGIRTRKHGDVMVFINPAIVAYSDKQTVLVEGCGSVAAAGLFGPVSRPARVTVEALDLEGNQFRLDASGLLAKVIQHEFDHLQGVLFIDKTDTKKLMSREAYLNKP